MKRRIAFLPATVPLILIAAQAAAQPAADSADTSLDEVVVVADRAPVPLSSVGSSVTVLDEQDIAASQATIASDLLAQTPGIAVARTGGVGEPTSVFIRGAESDQTVVVIDGVKMTDPSLPGGGFDFEDLLIGDISRIEILRGAQSTLYGSDAIGGVIDIVTADPTRKSAGSVSLEGGSHGTGDGTASVGGVSDALMWRAAGSYYGTSGIPCFDQYLGGRRDCASRIGNAAGQIRYDLTPDLQLDLRGYFVTARTDFDGYDTPNFTLGDDSEYGKTQQGIGYAGLTWWSPDHSLSNRLSVQYTGSETRNYDPNGPANFGNPTTETFYGFGRNIREEYQGTWKFAATGQVVFGAQNEHSTINTVSPFSPFIGAGVVVDSGFVQGQYEVLKGLTLTAGGRYDHHSAYGGHSTGQFAAAWVMPDQNTVLRASFGQGFKAPALYQLYSNYGNRALQPETANSWDAGIEHHALRNRLVVSATYFQRTSNELINFFDCSTPNPLCATEPFGYYANIARSKAHGVELDGSFEATDRLSLTANYTWTHAEDVSPGSSTYGNELPRRPADTGNAAASYIWPFHLRTAVALRYSAPSFDDAANQIRLGGYVLLDLRTSLPINDHVQIYARVQNLTDHHYEVAYQYGTFGRSAYVGARATF
ncbi:MAG TPA: TonB-dependent receptor [Steroidobacteraceae bacterium]|nr:TonB-dependent receptor [Steroidobacteraceae bacterium]